MLEYIQTDMWVRFQKLRGNQCIYVCADDAHGSAIMLRAEKEGITPEQLIANVQAEHSSDFADFLVDFDNFHSTHSEENRELSSLIYSRLREAGHIATRSVTQYFDPEKGMFLADRFIKGTCEVRGRRPVRRQLRKMRRHLRTHRAEEPQVSDLRCHPGTA